MTIQDYAARFVIDQWMAHQIPDDYIAYQKNNIERDAIHEAVKQAGGGWICIKPEWQERRESVTGNFEYTFKVNCRPVETARVYVYAPDYPVNQIPRDLHFCEYCGGHTKDDMRGHCAACGGPRASYKWGR